ncbi:MAG: hypothetical protein ABIA75_10060 [Candidatus Neomarinimicrobiota bacterium]
MKTKLILTQIALSVLCAQNFTSISISGNSGGIGYRATAEAVNLAAATPEVLSEIHDKYLYASQYSKRNQWKNKHESASRAVVVDILVPSGTVCKVYCNNGFSIGDLSVNSVTGDRLIVSDASGNQKDILLSSIVKIEIDDSRSNSRKDGGLIAALGKIISGRDPVVVNLGWLSLTEKAQTIQKVFL